MQPPASGLQDSRMSTAGTPEAAWLMPEQLNVPHCHHDELKLHANQHHPSRAAAAVAAATANTAANAAYAGAANAASIPVPTSGASQVLPDPLSHNLVALHVSSRMLSICQAKLVDDLAAFSQPLVAWVASRALSKAVMQSLQVILPFRLVQHHAVPTD